MRLLRDSTLAQWRPLAKDGAELPPAQAVERPALAVLGAGNTLDIDLLRVRGESLMLELRRDGVVFYRVPVHVR